MRHFYHFRCTDTDICRRWLPGLRGFRKTEIPEERLWRHIVVNAPFQDRLPGEKPGEVNAAPQTALHLLTSPCR